MERPVKEGNGFAQNCNATFDKNLVSMKEGDAHQASSEAIATSHCHPIPT